MQPKKPRETDLYGPVKALLESQGYAVKGEVGAADIMAMRGEDAPLIVELKMGFSLTLFHQAIARQSITDAVYVAVPYGSGAAFLKSVKSNMALCRRLGLGLILVRLKDGHAEIRLDPAPYAPRKSALRKTRLLKEFAKLEGDPNIGGAVRRGLVTAYRQDALRCVDFLAASGPSKAAHVARETGVETARSIMADNHHGWFERISTGIYGLSPNGQKQAGR